MNHHLGAMQRREDLIPVVAPLIRELPTEAQLVLSLYYVEELTLPEIARVLDRPEDQVCQLYTAARSFLRTQLAA
jgi:DNA-directed RNA polymerase specialized sigma subunit